VVELEELGVVARAEQACGLAGEMAEDVHRDGEVGRVEDGDALGEVLERAAAGLVEAGRAGHVGDAALGGGGEIREGRGGDGEVDGDAAVLERAVGSVVEQDALFEGRAEVGMARALEGAGQPEGRLVAQRRPDLEPHATLGADDHHASAARRGARPCLPVRILRPGAHCRMPRSLRTTRSRSWWTAVSGVSGSRISSLQRPSTAAAAFTGIGFVSQKSTSKSGSSA